MNIEEKIKEKCKKDIRSCSGEELYGIISGIAGELAAEKIRPSCGKKLYYVSAEFLLGRMLVNNLINLGIYDEVKTLLERNGKSVSSLEEYEKEPSLGNGGLGRLAACFLDSIASLGLNGDGIGLCYHFGLFRQKFENNMQKELPDVWLSENSGLIKTDTVFDVRLGGKTVKSRMYNLPVTGYENDTRLLHLFDLESVSEDIVGEGISFDKRNLEKNLTLFLYPDDSDEDGRKLRIYQQYFMVSSAAQFILEECVKKGCTLRNLHEYAVIQINDTHPAMIIPELIRLLMKKGADEDAAIETVTKTCAYTNHTILSEALEKFPIEYLKEAAPELLAIIEMLDKRVKKTFSDKAAHIIDENNIAHTARIAVHFTFATNGVAALHTDILKNNTLNAFYKIYPEKFSNKTNGISFRRWLIKCNPKLTGFIEELIGPGFKRNADELQKLEKFRNDGEALERLIEIKAYNKKLLLDTLLKGREVNPDGVFDIQAKRLHEYKRQQMNALYLIREYLDIKSGKFPKRPINAIFAAKAAPAYTIAKDIIHLILCLEKLIMRDNAVKKHLTVSMIENYNVSAAEKLIPACDVSEQISLASKEASGTGNMKFMLNGAITLGSFDGANVEIYNLVGKDNIYIFGSSSDEVIKRYESGGYNPREIYENNANIKETVDFITSDTLTKIGNAQHLRRLRDELVGKDYFMTFPDLDSYTETKRRLLSDFENRTARAKKMLANISRSGYFSSDRTIKEYNKDIWEV